MNYSFDMHGYLDTISGLIQNIKNNQLNPATLSNNKSNKTIFKNAYYPALMNDNTRVKNTCDFSKSIVLSGPNASGKTTILKTSIINAILTQQFGYGCYEEATVIPFKFIHCYLNIPDTSGRDSLFQAEARRCKDIIDIIDANPEDTHFCAFDELYSGTNPEDAVASSLAFMQYISSNKNVSSILTTHYNKVCRKLAKNKRIQNYNMKTVSTENNTFLYTYQLEKGISNIKGGVKVLSELNYPSAIVENTRNMISSFYK
jgi:DNA mismatch repair ATPase MutS